MASLSCVFLSLYASSIPVGGTGWKEKEMPPATDITGTGPAQEVTSDRDCTMNGSRSPDRSEVSSSSASLESEFAPGAESSSSPSA